MQIRELKIYSSNHSWQIEFYSKTLGLVLIHQTENVAQFKIGKSRLVLMKSARSQPYHLAINIPSNRLKEALAWLKLRVDILKSDGNEIQDFSPWDAQSVYFYDQDKNIVELIARKHLNNENQAPFDADSFLEISEIGLPVNDLEATYNALRDIVDIQIYDGNFERFCAIGDERGLFICIDKTAKTWFPTGDKACSSDFEIKFEEKGLAYEVAFKNGKINKS
jgi:catechol-2,3-dioxygenase